MIDVIKHHFAGGVYCKELRIPDGYEVNGKFAGIYKITNMVNDKIYIGSSVDVKRRLRNHISTLSNGKHRNIHLQRSWQKHGANNFEFEIIEICQKEKLIELEQKWIDDLCAAGNNGFNILPFAESRFGRVVSEETRKKISESLKGHTVSNETRMLQSIYQQQRPATSQKTREKISLSGKGRVKSAEERQKLSVANKGKVLSEEHKKKIAISHFGKTLTEEHKEKIRTASFGNKSNLGKVLPKLQTARMSVGIATAWAKRKAIPFSYIQLEVKNVI